MTTKKQPGVMGLGEIVRELIDNSGAIKCLTGSKIGSQKFRDDTSLRREIEGRQEQLYQELNSRESSYL